MKTKTEQIMDYFRDNPRSSNKEAAEALNTTENTVKGTLWRLRGRGWIEFDDRADGGRSVRILKGSDKINFNFKKETYSMMIDVYLEDFQSAETWRERVDIGQMIMKIMKEL